MVAVSGPPTVHWPGWISLATTPSANARHPGSPQAPQLAPGSRSETRSIRGSSHTKNARCATARMTARTHAESRQKDDGGQLGHHMKGLARSMNSSRLGSSGFNGLPQ